MNSPALCYSPAPASSSSPSMSFNLNTYATTSSLIDRVRFFTNYIEEFGERDLYNFFIEIVQEIFGRGSTKGWALDSLRTRPFDEQKYICRESDSVYQFLYSKGYIFKLCYKLLSANSLLKFQLYFSDIPIDIKQKIEKSPTKSYYGSRFFYHVNSDAPIGLSLNSFEYYMFNFGLYGLKLAADDILDFGVQSSEQPVYRLLCIDYLKFFLPLDNSASMILPQLQFNVLSSIPNQKLCTNPSKLLNFIKKDIALKDFSNDTVESSSWILTSEATWRSEIVAFYFTDLWLNCSVSSVLSVDLTKLIRCFIKHLHLYSNCVKHLPTDNLKLILRARHGVKIYQYLAFYMDNWPQDFSFRLILENWLCYIQPWRYEDLVQQQYSITEQEMNDKWRVFIIRNLLCYTKLFNFAIKRFTYTDICSPRYSIMIHRMLKVFAHPYLLKIILNIEDMYTNNQSHHKKWNVLLSECLFEAEGPLYNYELMFSEERIHEYKLFCSKIQKTLDCISLELQRFQEEKLDRNNTSMLELILTPRRIQKSDYTLSEWEDIQANLKSSLIFMEQIINLNVTSTPPKIDLSTWSISNLSINNASNIFNKSYLINQSSQRNTSYSFSKNLTHSKEWEIDPDYLGTLSYENDSLVKFSKYLRNIVEFNWNSYVLRFSTEKSLLAGVLRQTLIRAPMKIYSYEPRNDGSGKRVRTPKVVPPVVSFRWIASYFTLSWIVFLLALISVSTNIGFWTSVILILRIIYLCIKYLLGYSPPFKWECVDDS